MFMRRKGATASNDFAMASSSYSARVELSANACPAAVNLNMLSCLIWSRKVADSSMSKEMNENSC